ncbi:MAG: PhnD/SsuA/transferrin family substrate-binding protein [Candidatus Saccharibacteria bacterium]|nr:PhnD/SsuA/transferrin family substrate-binding protein [Pseudorhodobacter sp.]
MIASLAMYDRTEVQPSNDRLWALIRNGIRAVGLKAPETLTRGPAAYWPAWQSPDLILSQTCGFPYRARLHSHVTLIGTPDYGLEGCPPGYYRSIFVARQTDPRQTLAEFDNAALAFSEDLSQSGWAAPQNHARSLGLTLRPMLRSGSHIMAARAVAEGQADIAAIDALTWSMIQEWEPYAGALKPIAATDPTPGLPYAAAPGADAARLFPIVAEAIANLPLQDRRILRLNGFVQIPAAAYLAVVTPPSPAELGLPE